MTSRNTIALLLFIVAASVILYLVYQDYRSTYDPAEVQDSMNPSDGDISEHSIPSEEIVTGNPYKDGIPAIDEPSFESVYAADLYIDNQSYGLMVEVEDQVRYYPYQILVWHEIVNDTIAGKKIAVTYSPLSQTGVVYERAVDGVVYDFGVSGKLHNNNLLMYDRQTGSLWSQARAEAVVGELTGATLERYPSLTMTWEVFRNNYPNGLVLSRETGHNRDYTSDPYAPSGYYASADLWFNLSHLDDRLFVKELVYGYVTAGGQAKAYPLSLIQELGFIQDKIGEDSVVIIWDEDLQTVRAFSPILDDGIERMFESLDDFLQNTSNGSTLNQVPFNQSFWFSWAASHPETELYVIE